MAVVFNVGQEHIQQEEQQRHAVIVDMEKVVLLEHYLVKHVQRVHTDQQQQIVHVQLVQVENIHRVEQKKALIV